MQVKIDGASKEFETNVLPGVSNDIVWKDTYGIMFWRCILTITMTLISMKGFSRAKDGKGVEHKLLCVGASILYILTMLISMRIIF